MLLEDRDFLIHNFYLNAKKIIIAKGKDYEPSGIAFKNLKEEADELGISPLQFLLIHMSKHYAALRSYVKNNGQVESESIESRLYDLANYAALFYTLIEDLRKEGEK